jgi:hypothetical protein
VSINKRSAATARLRSVRLLVDDLRAVELELSADTVSWRIGSREPLGTWSWKNVYTQSDSLDELAGAAPKGRVYEFEVQAQAGDQSFVLLMAANEPRFLTFSYDGPGEETPEIFWTVLALLKKAEKRGAKWHFVGAVIGPSLALSIPLGILDQVGRLGFFYDETRPPANLGTAYVWAAVSFLFLALIVAGSWSWSTASSVTLRPIIDATSIVERAIDGAKSVGRWFVTIPKAEYMYKLVMLWSTVVAALCAIGAFFVTLLK